MMHFQGLFIRFRWRLDFNCFCHDKTTLNERQCHASTY